uniref:Uncharacterized protein n=1 Tax=Zea mays TaxID=4577 RepID=A0A804R8P5_MAIZE
MARMRALEGKQLLEDDPTVVYLTAYLLTLDAQYDFLARHHRQMIARAEDAEKLNRKLHVDLTTVQARVATLESREVIAVEALKQAKDEHVQKLMEAYLAMDKQEHPESSQDPPPELFEPLTMKKIPAPSLRSKKKPQAPRQHRCPLRNYKSQSSLKKSSTPSFHLSRREKKSSTSAPS